MHKGLIRWWWKNSSLWHLKASRAAPEEAIIVTLSYLLSYSIIVTLSEDLIKRLCDVIMRNIYKIIYIQELYQHSLASYPTCDVYRSYIAGCQAYRCALCKEHNFIYINYYFGICMGGCC